MLVSPEVAAHSIELKHQVDGKRNQYEKEIIMVEHDALHNTSDVARLSQHGYGTFSLFALAK